MCRSIKPLFNFDPPATEEEIRAAALQFVHKLSGFNAPSKVNEAAFCDAVDEVSEVAHRLIDRLETSASPRNRAREAEKGEAARRRAIRAAGFGLRLSGPTSRSAPSLSGTSTIRYNALFSREVTAQLAPELATSRLAAARRMEALNGGSA